MVIFGIASVALAAALGEVSLRSIALLNSASADPRCAGSDLTQFTQRGLYVPEPVAGYVMRPNICIRLRTGEYDEVLRTNSRGLVGRAGRR